MHLKIKKNRESNFSKGLRNLNQTNLMRIEAEKKQLRYAIHDNILQDMEMSRKYIERLRDESADHLVSDKAVLIETSIRRSISDLRRLLEGLPYWDTSSFTFKDNIVNLIEKMRTKLGPAIHLTILGVKKAPLVSHQMEQLLSILQEALNNAVEHSGAKNIFVKVLWANPVLRMSIEDDGAGLPKEKEVFETSNRMGLLGMRERAYAIGSHFKLVSAKDKGVKIDIELSMENQRE